MQYFIFLLTASMFVCARLDDSWEPKDEYSCQMKNAAKNGIAQCSKCKNISIVGAGVAGLTAALELALSGHNVIIYEANNRTGGRVLTYRNLTHGYITELGAMRLPLDLHTLLATYIKRLNLETNEFINYSPNGIVYLNDIPHYASEQRGADDFDFDVKDSEKGVSADDLWERAMDPLYKEIDLDGLPAFNEKYKSYSVDTYLNSINMSLPAINFIGLMLNLETSLFAALTEIIQDRHVFGQKFYHIKGGNDQLTDSLLAACLDVPHNRCSIQYNTRVTGVTIRDGVKADVTYTDYSTSSQNLTSLLYDHVIVATTATAANIIDFNDRRDFVKSYRAMRQVHYDCASKIALFFSKQWWTENTQVNIKGGRSTTDLPVRFVYYHNFNVSSSSLDDGAAILASYTWSQDAQLWQSISDDLAFAIALDNLDRLHHQEVLDYYTGGVTKHWCNDNYSHGAYVVFTPFQEQYIQETLALSVRNIVHFIGEHTSSIHAWIEGATLSALRVAMQIQEESFDVAIIGGGPIGLLTAIQLAKKAISKNIVIVEQFTIGNLYGGSHDSVRQFRQPHSERYLADLAMISFDKWRQLESDLGLPTNTLLDTTHGFLYFGNGQLSPDTVEGNLNKIDLNCDELKMNCEKLNGTQLRRRFPFFGTSATVDRGIFHNNSGYINVTLLLSVLRTTIETQYKNILIRENESFLDLDQSVPDSFDYVRLRTSRGSLQANQVVFVPGPYAKNISATLGFTLNMTMWELPTLYFRLNSSTDPPPTWLFSGGDQQSLFNGYPIEASDRPGFLKISPEFIQSAEDVLIYPKDRRGSKMDFEYFIKQSQAWIQSYAAYVDPNNYFYDNTSTCLATFVPDNGFIIDHLPSNVNYNRKIVMYAAGWGMKFAPVWAEILTYMVLGTESTLPYADYLPNFSFNIEGRVINQQSTTVSPFITTTTAHPVNSWQIVSLLEIFAIGILVALVIYLHRKSKTKTTTALTQQENPTNS